MTNHPPFNFSPKNFSGTVRLFPLPNLVLFPHVVQPLHIYEPRYCDLLADALDDDRLIALATLVPGWEHDYDGRPPVSPHACLGRVILHHETDDGTFNVLLAGLSRIEIMGELASVKSYRYARAILRPDRFPDDCEDRTEQLIEDLRTVAGHLLPFVPSARKQLNDLLQRGVSLATLTDLIAYLIDVDLAEKLILLGEENVVCRAEILARRLAALTSDTCVHARSELPFPPAPSCN